MPGARLSGAYGKPIFISLGDEVRLFRTTYGFGKGKKLLVPDALCAAFSPDGRWLLIGSSDKIVRQIDLATEQVVATYDRSQGVPRTLAFSANSRRFASGGDDRIVRFWELHSPKEIARTPRHAAPIQAIVFTHDGRYALSAADDALVHLWNLPREKKSS